MTNRRKRVTCNDKCLLVIDGNTYSCNLVNISIAGALIQCEDAFPAILTPGIRCGVLLCRNPGMCPGAFPARVVRLEAPKIAVQFLDFEL